MEKYSRVFHFDDHLYLKNSPLIILAGAILKNNETDEVIAQLKLKNISNSKIKAVEVLLTLYDPAGEIQEKKVNYDFLDLNIYRNGEFGSKEAIPLPYKNTRSFDIIVKKVIFDDDKTWINNKNFYKITKQKNLNTILETTEIDYFKKKFGDKSEFVPFVEKDTWYCCCGNINTIDEKKCYCCGVEMNDISNIDYDLLKKEALYDLSLYYLETDNVKLIEEAEESFKSLKNFKDSNKKQKECSAKIKELIELKEKNTKKAKKILLRIILCIVVLSAIIGSILFITKVYIPNKNYTEAKKLILKEDYEKAINKLEKLPSDYKDADKVLKDCYISYAKKLTNEGKYEKAISIYEKIGTDDLDDNKLETIYKYANNLFENKEFEKAYDKYLMCGKYKDSVDNAKKSAVEIGNIKLDDKKYEEAMEWYKKADNEDLINKSKYTYVMDHKNSEDTTTYKYLVELVQAKYDNSLDVYKSLYNINCTIVLNSSKDDNSSSPSTIKQYDNGYKKLYGHYIINGNIPGGKANITTLYQTRWGYDNVVKEDWKDNKYWTSTKPSSKALNEWSVAYLDMASNLYYHRAYIYNADTGEQICSSKEVYTPYNR